MNLLNKIEYIEEQEKSAYIWLANASILVVVLVLTTLAVVKFFSLV